MEEEKTIPEKTDEEEVKRPVEKPNRTGETRRNRTAYGEEPEEDEA